MHTRGSVKEVVSGLIERVTFFNEENGFAVLRVKAENRRELVTVVGNLPSVSAGEWLTAEGQWVRDRDHGFQLKADVLKSVPPTTRAGIEKYLGSGMVKGIGPVYAKKLVACFGENIFDIIEEQSVRLEEVDGIGPARRKRIKAAWDEQKFVREIMVFLHSHGVGTSRAVRIFKIYGVQAIDRIRQNPYALARDIPGIGFQTADQIAQRVGIPADSMLRASAALLHMLAAAMDEGHCALPRAELLERTEALLKISPDIVGAALAELLAKEELVADAALDQDLVYLPALRQAELGIAAKIRALAAGRPAYPAIQVAKAIEWCEGKSQQVLASGQREALAAALRHQALVITGGPGVGKTTLINSLLKILSAKRVKFLLCAPTGRAAKRLNETTGHPAQTIHRLLEFQPVTRACGRNENRPLDAQLVVVDETSMVDVLLMHRLLRAVGPATAVIFVGDVDQLPAVGPGLVLRNFIESNVVPVAALTEVFRQAAGSQIVQVAHGINRGVLPAAQPDGASSDFYFIERKEPEEIARTLIEVVKDRIPRHLGIDPIRDIQVLCPMHRGSLGTREINGALQNVLNPLKPGMLGVERFGSSFRAGDKVIQTENNYDKEVFNGDIGQIREIDPGEQQLTIRFDLRDVTYGYDELDEIALAYAISVHKAQGSEFSAVVIPVAMQQFILLQRNLIYTAVTRGKHLVVLVGERKAFAMAVRNNRTADRYSGLPDRLHR